MRLFEVINHFLKQHQRTIHTIGLITAVGVQLAQAFKLPLPPTTANAITFAVLAYILKDVSENTSVTKCNKIYTNQDEMYGDLIQQIKGIERVKEAILIQYSGRKASGLISTLLSKGAKVTVYLKNSDGEVINQIQQERINRTITELPTDVRGSSGMLEIYQYDPPASIRGVIIDNRVLAIGWYVYEYVPKSERSHNYPNDKLAVWGHDTPGMLIYKGSLEFEIFKKAFSKQVRNYKQNMSELNRKPSLRIKEGKIIPINHPQNP